MTALQKASVLKYVPTGALSQVSSVLLEGFFFCHRGKRLDWRRW